MTPEKPYFLPSYIFSECRLQNHTLSYGSSLPSFRWTCLNLGLSPHLLPRLTIQRLFSAISPIQAFATETVSVTIQLLNTSVRGCNSEFGKSGRCRSHGTTFTHYKQHLTPQSVPWGQQGSSQFPWEANITASSSYRNLPPPAAIHKPTMTYLGFQMRGLCRQTIFPSLNFGVLSHPCHTGCFLMPIKVSKQCCCEFRFFL